MVDINKIFKMQKQADELERNKELIERLTQQPLIDKVTLERLSQVGKSFASLNNLRLAEISVNQRFLDYLNSFQHSSFQNLQKIIEEKLRPFSEFNPLNDRIKNSFKELQERLTSPYKSVHSGMLRNFEQLSRAITISGFDTLSKTILEKYSLLESQNVLGQISKSLIDYDRFANNTLAKLNLALDKATSLALKASLRVANEQVLRSTNTINTYVENFDVSNLVLNQEFPRGNRYRIQREELLQRDDIEEDESYNSLIIKSPSALSFELISKCMSSIVLCNEATKILKGEDMFKLTNTMFEASWKLPTIVPTNKDNFAIIVDCLIFILVEGAGKDFLRFIDYKDGKHSGYFLNTDPEVEVIWKIKHLRNKWLRHDIEHGKNINKDYQIRKETLEWFGMQKIPRSKDEFIFLYNNLILKVEEFLNLLFERVSKFTN